MSLSSPFITRPIGTTLLTIAVAIAGGISGTGTFTISRHCDSASRGARDRAQRQGR